MSCPSAFVWCWQPVEAIRTERRWGQKSLITLEVWADGRVRGQKSKLRSRIHRELGARPMQARGHRESGWAAEPGGPAGYTVTPRGRLLAEATACHPSCTSSPSTLVRTSPPWVLPGDPVGAENWKQLAGRTAGQRQGAEVDLGKNELYCFLPRPRHVLGPVWFFLRKDAGRRELGSQGVRGAHPCSAKSKGNQGKKKKVNWRLNFWHVLLSFFF